MNTCPIDNMPCEGACGEPGSKQCLAACTHGADFARKATKYSPRVDGRAADRKERMSKKQHNHGSPRWAERYGCQCEPCLDALKIMRTRRAEAQKRYRKKQTA